MLQWTLNIIWLIFLSWGRQSNNDAVWGEEKDKPNEEWDFTAKGLGDDQTPKSMTDGEERRKARNGGQGGVDWKENYSPATRFWPPLLSGMSWSWSGMQMLAGGQPHSQPALLLVDEGQELKARRGKQKAPKEVARGCWRLGQLRKSRTFSRIQDIKQMA